MIPAWFVKTYVKSEMPLTDKVIPVMEFTFVIISDESPSARMVEDLVNAHTRNVELLFSEISFTPLPDDINTDF